MISQTDAAKANWGEKNALATLISGLAGDGMPLSDGAGAQENPYRTSRPGMNRRGGRGVVRRCPGLAGLPRCADGTGGEVRTGLISQPPRIGRKQARYRHRLRPIQGMIRAE